VLQLHKEIDFLRGEMDSTSIRTLNLIATIWFGIFGVIIFPLSTYFQLYFIFERNPLAGLYQSCQILFFLWVFFNLFIAIMLYDKTVIGIDEGNYESSKRWMLVGIILGLVGGVIPTVLFVISYYFFDSAIWTNEIQELD
jgi:hypothetical protein